MSHTPHTTSATHHHDKQPQSVFSDRAATLILTLNGKPTHLSCVETVADLLIQLGYQGKRVAVECNGQIVPRGLHAQTLLHNGDQLEIVVAVGGG